MRLESQLFTLHTSHFTLHSSLFTLHSSLFTLPASRFTPHPSPLMLGWLCVLKSQKPVPLTFLLCF